MSSYICYQCASNVIKILQWSLKPHGSAWIARQAFLFLEEEFFVVANSDVLAALDPDTLTKILQSDFLQVKKTDKWLPLLVQIDKSIHRQIDFKNLYIITIHG